VTWPPFGTILILSIEIVSGVDFKTQEDLFPEELFS